MTYKNSSITICEPTDEEWDLITTTSWWIQGIASLILSCLGLLLNSLAVFILVSSKKSDSFNRLLACLAVFDNMYLLNGISESIRGYLIQPNYYYDFIFISFLFPFRSMKMFCSIYTTILLYIIRTMLQCNKVIKKINCFKLI